MKWQLPEHASPQTLRAMELISALCDERITPEEIRELEALVIGDAQIRRIYLRLMHLDAGLHHYASALGSLPDPDLELTDDSGNEASPRPMEETMVLPAVRESDFQEDEEFVVPYQPPPPPIDSQKNTHFSRQLKGGLAAVLVIGAGMLAYILFSHPDKVATNSVNHPSVAVVPLPPPPPAIPVATVDLTRNSVWDPSNMPPEDGVFVAGQVLALKSGDVQLAFHRGGNMVVEGPAQIAFVSDSRIKLISGKIFATIPGGGLTVECPTGSVTDLGTQFGVAVHPDGGTEVAVFQGHVAASLNSIATTQDAKPMVLGVGEAAVITAHALAVDDAGAVPQRFVRSLVNNKVTSLDVTDMLCGGDGTTLRRGFEVDPRTGAVGKIRLNDYTDSDGRYHPSFGYPVIDGAFIPDGSKNAMVVDSSGDSFNFAPAGNRGWGRISAGRRPTFIYGTIAGVDYNTSDHAIIFIHANGGLTLDLDAVRRMYPDRELSGFHCGVGNSYLPKSKTSGAMEKLPVATADVLINGALRYQKQEFTSRDGRLAIDLPLTRNDRFLTLVSTDAGKGNDHDWILWVDAKLDLSAKGN
jgi:hypothetical protein